MGQQAVLTATRDLLVAELGIKGLDRVPDRLGEIFTELPVVVVDADDTIFRNFRTDPNIDQGYLVDWTIFCEVLVELSSGDTGQADAAVKGYLDQMEQLFTNEPYLGGAVNRARITQSKVEGIPREVRDIGVTVRQAWLRLEVEQTLAPS